MTDIKIVELEREATYPAPVLACPLQLDVMDPEGRLWPLLKVRLHSSQLQLKRLNEQDPLPKSERHVLLLVDNPLMSPVYEELERKVPGKRPLIFVGDVKNTQLVRRAMRIGAVDFLPYDCDPSELWSALGRIATQLNASAELAPVTVVVNGKSGSGVSFICANLGHALSKQRKVALLDANLQYGSLTDYLNIKDKQGSLADAMARATELDSMALAGMVSQAREQLDVLPSSSVPLSEERPVSAKQCAQLLHLVRSQYGLVLVDMSRGPESWNLPILESAEHVLVVMQQSLSGLRETIYLLKQLRHELGIGKNKIILLINRYDKKKDVSIKEIEKATEIKQIVTLANDFALAETCTDLGQLVVEVKSNHKLVAMFESITTSLLAKPGAQEANKPGLFKRLLGRHS
ncbi:AAA family ATPase [Zobellella maritima]|uniref:AAA family ATPase n=1 Tax=Zobellella maritima TaxID=2059725 RepID=UPI000E30541F|nr:AAA family ATPase [Zobellella maritima]